MAGEIDAVSLKGHRTGSPIVYYLKATNCCIGGILYQDKFTISVKIRYRGVIAVLFKRAVKKKSPIGTPEAHHLWDTLSSKYTAFEKIQLWENYAHDLDLKHFLASVRRSMKKNMTLLEKQIEKYNIPGPEGHIRDVRYSINSEVLRDEYIAVDTFTFIQESIEMLLQAIRSCVTNDDIRHIFTGILREAVEATDFYMRYLRLKGWMKQPPLYPNVRPEAREKLASSEAFHLWDLLTYRNDNIEQTKKFYSLANDMEFKLLLKHGLEMVLQRQADMLEKELKHFGIPLPIRAPKYLPDKQDTTIMDDDSMFRNIFIGVQGAAIFHANAFKKATTNDRVRNIFKDLLLSEIEIQDDMIKFGKIKGWFNPVPEYGTSKG